MKNLYAVANECLKELDDIGIQYGKITEFTVNTRAKSRWGMCKHHPATNCYSIEISSRLLDDNADIKGLKETIHHEILHTCMQCFSHGKEWQAVCNKVNKAYGYNIKRTDSAKDKGFTDEQAQEMIRENYKYVFKCENCGQTIHYMRNTYFVQNYTRYQCGICKGKFKPLV